MENKLLAIFLFLLLLGCSNVKDKNILVVKQLGPRSKIQFSALNDSVQEESYSFFKHAKTLTDDEKKK
ncbi:MAG: hypothetical protein ACTHLE_26465 [Agriterribacter sp.]